MRFSGGHIVGQASDKDRVLATSALDFKIVSHHGGPKYILCVNLVAAIKSDQLKEHIMETFYKIRKQGGIPVSFICDNCPLNQGAYSLLGGPGEVNLGVDGHKAFLAYDFDHIYKNIRNNWITEPTKELLFSLDGKEFLACWSDIENLYKEDRETPVRLTTLNYTAVSPKPLQWQSIDLVSKVFNDKTIAALQLNELKKKFGISEGTSIFVSLISNWYKIMNVKSKYLHIHQRDEDREPWSKDCKSFKKLKDICKVIESCKWGKQRGRSKKLTCYTADAFISTTLSNISAANYLINIYDFKFVLPGSVNSQSPLEKFFGQARQRKGGNFYIDYTDVLAAAKVQRLHQLLKHGIIPEGEGAAPCRLCNIDPYPEDLEYLSEITIVDTQSLLETTSVYMEKLIYISGFLSHKHFEENTDSNSDDDPSEYIEHLSRGGLRVPRLNLVFFVHTAMGLYEKLTQSRQSCTKYFHSLLSFVDTPYSNNVNICKRLTNIIFKAEVMHKSDRENELGCLRRREKLSSGM